MTSRERLEPHTRPDARCARLCAMVVVPVAYVALGLLALLAVGALLCYVCYRFGEESGEVRAHKTLRTHLSTDRPISTVVSVPPTRPPAADAQGGGVERGSL